MTYILYHADCPDGFGAAYSAWKKYGNQVQYIPVNHNQALPDLLNNSEIYMVDFCYPPAILLKLARRMKQITVLDHHISAKEALDGVDLTPYSNLTIHFDMNKSGAVLAWEYFQQTEVPEFLQYVEDKDLWRFRLPYSKEFSAALRCYEMKFDVWNKLINHVPQLLEEGKVLLRYQNQMVAKLCKNAYLMDIGGYQVPAVNSAVLQSEIGNHLCLTKPEFPFAVVYFEVEQKRYFSLRSVGDFDVAKVAASFGGGGHKNASGFVVG